MPNQCRFHRPAARMQTGGSFRDRHPAAREAPLRSGIIDYHECRRRQHVLALRPEWALAPVIVFVLAPQWPGSSLFAFLSGVAVWIQRAEAYVKLCYRPWQRRISAFPAKHLDFMNVSLTPELEKFISERFASGFHQTASEVVREGLRMLQQRDDQIQRSRQKRSQPPARDRRNHP